MPGYTLVTGMLGIILSSHIYLVLCVGFSFCTLLSYLSVSVGICIGKYVVLFSEICILLVISFIVVLK